MCPCGQKTRAGNPAGHDAVRSTGSQSWQFREVVTSLIHLRGRSRFELIESVRATSFAFSSTSGSNRKRLSSNVCLWGSSSALLTTLRSQRAPDVPRSTRQGTAGPRSSSAQACRGARCFLCFVRRAAQPLVAIFKCSESSIKIFASISNLTSICGSPAVVPNQRPMAMGTSPPHISSFPAGKCPQNRSLPTILRRLCRQRRHRMARFLQQVFLLRGPKLEHLHKCKLMFDRRLVDDPATFGHQAPCLFTIWPIIHRCISP